VPLRLRVKLFSQQKLLQVFNTKEIAAKFIHFVTTVSKRVIITKTQDGSHGLHALSFLLFSYRAFSNAIIDVR
jgi:hypothetical protein